MAEIKTYTAEDLQDGQYYLSVLSSGVIIVKSVVDNKIVTRINPTEEYTTIASAGGKAAHANRVDAEVAQLLTALEIDVTDERAKFLAKSAVTGKSGDNLRSFLALVDMFKPDQVVDKPVVVMNLSDRAYQDLVGRMTDQGYIPQPWMYRDDLSPDTDDLSSHDVISVEDIQKIVNIPGVEHGAE